MVRRLCGDLIIGDGMAPIAFRFRKCGAVPRGDNSSERRSALVKRSIKVRGCRTSIRLEPQVLDMLAEVCRRESCTIEDVCCHVAGLGYGSLASSLRVFILDYFHASATEGGHRNAGHGQGMFLSERQLRLAIRTNKADCREPAMGRTTIYGWRCPGRVRLDR